MNVLSLKWLPATQIWNAGGKHRWKRMTPIAPEWAQEFWNYYRKNKFLLLNKGYSVYKDRSGAWYLCHTVDDIKEFGDVKSAISADDLKEKPFVSKLKPYKIKDSSGLRPWQINSVERIVSVLNEYDGALNGSDTGTGKTYSSIGVARELGMKIGVVCPKSVINDWKRVTTKHFKMKDKLEFVVNYESLRTGKFKNIATWVKDRKTHRETFTWHIQKNVLLVFDESHRCKSTTSQNSTMLLQASKQGYKTICCSATNAISPLEMRAVGYSIKLYKGSFWNWTKENGCVKGRWGGMEFDGNKKILKKLHTEIFEERGIRLRRDEIPDFPQSDIQAISYNLDEADEKELNRIYADMDKELKEIERKSLNIRDKIANSMVVQLRARQKAELLRIPLLVDLVNDSIEDGMSCVIFLNFIESIKSLSEKLNTKHIIWGQNKKTKTYDERQEYIDSFQSDKSRIIIIQTQSGGSGISLHDLNGKYPRISFISPTNSAVDLRQCLGRVHRDGALTKSLQRIVYIANTAEEDTAQRVQGKLNNLDLINDGTVCIGNNFMENIKKL